MRRQCEALKWLENSQQKQAQPDSHAALHWWPAHIHPSEPPLQRSPCASAPHNSSCNHSTCSTLPSAHSNNTAVPDPFAPYRKHYGTLSHENGVSPLQTTRNLASPQRNALMYHTYATSNSTKRHTNPAPRIADTRSSLLRKQTTQYNSRNEDTSALFKPSIFEFHNTRASNHSAPSTPMFAFADGAPKYVHPVPRLKAKTQTRCATPPTPKRVTTAPHLGVAARNRATSSASPIKKEPSRQPSASKGMDRPVLFRKKALTLLARRDSRKEQNVNCKPVLPSPPRLTSSKKQSQRKLLTRERVDSANSGDEQPSNRSQAPSCRETSPKAPPPYHTEANAFTQKPSVLPKERPAHSRIQPKARVPRVRTLTTPVRQSPFKSKLGITVTVPRVEMTKVKEHKGRMWKDLHPKDDSWPWSPASMSIPPEHSLGSQEGASTPRVSLQPFSMNNGSARRRSCEDDGDGIALSQNASVSSHDIDHLNSRVELHDSRCSRPSPLETRTPLIPSESPDRLSLETVTASPCPRQTSTVEATSALEGLTQNAESIAVRCAIQKEEEPVATTRTSPKRARRDANGNVVWNPLNQPCLRAMVASNKKLAGSPEMHPPRRKPASIRDCEPWGGAFRDIRRWEEANGVARWMQHVDGDDDSPCDDTVRRQSSPCNKRGRGGTPHSFGGGELRAAAWETAASDKWQPQPWGSSPRSVVQYDSPQYSTFQSNNGALCSSPSSVRSWGAATFRDDDGLQDGDDHSCARMRDTACNQLLAPRLDGAPYRNDVTHVGDTSMRRRSMYAKAPRETGKPRSDANARNVMRNAAWSQQQTASGGTPYHNDAQQRSETRKSNSVAAISHRGETSCDSCQPRRDAHSVGVVEHFCSPHSTASWGYASNDDVLQKCMDTSTRSTTAVSRSARNSHYSSRSRSDADSGVVRRSSVCSPLSTRDVASVDDAQKRMSAGLGSMTAVTRCTRIVRDSGRSQNDDDSLFMERYSARSSHSAVSCRKVWYDDRVLKPSGASNCMLATASRTRNDTQWQNASPSTALTSSPPPRSTRSHRSVSPRVFASPRRPRSLSFLLRACVDTSSDVAIMRQAHQEHFLREAAAAEELTAALKGLQRMCPDGVGQFDEAFNALEESFQIRMEALNRAICAAEKRVGKDRSGPRVQGAVRYCLLKVAKVALKRYSLCADLIDMMREREELKRRGFSPKYGRMEELAVLILQNIMPPVCTSTLTKYCQLSEQVHEVIPHWRGVPYSEVIWLEQCWEDTRG